MAMRRGIRGQSEPPIKPKHHILRIKSDFALISTHLYFLDFVGQVALLVKKIPA